MCIYMSVCRCKLVILAHVKKLTVIKGEDELMGARIHIQACREAFVYLLAPLRHVSIDHCQNCTFVLGAVEGIVNLIHCTQCTVIAMCGQLQTRESALCVFHLCTPCKPVFLSGNDNLRLAPYHTFYPSLDQHMARAGLTPGLNKWDSPIVTEESEEESPVYQLLPPDELYPFTVPYRMPGHLKV
jgi:TBCC domain-containing protein 1